MLKLNLPLPPVWLTPEYFRQTMKTHTHIITHIYFWNTVCVCLCVWSCLTIRDSLLHCCTTNRWLLPYCSKLNTRQGPLLFSTVKPHRNTVISVLSLTFIMKYCKYSPLNNKVKVYWAPLFMSQHTGAISGPVSRQNTSSASKQSGKAYRWNGTEGTKPL